MITASTPIHPPPDPENKTVAPLVRQQSDQMTPAPIGSKPEQHGYHMLRIAPETRIVKGFAWASHFRLVGGRTPAGTSIHDQPDLGSLLLPFYEQTSHHSPSGFLSLAKVMEIIRDPAWRDQISAIRRLGFAAEKTSDLSRRRILRRTMATLELDLPSVDLTTTPAGDFTGLVPVKINDIVNPDQARDALFLDDPRIAMAMVCPSGKDLILVYMTDCGTAPLIGLSSSLVEELAGRFGFSVRLDNGTPARLSLGCDPDIRFRPDAEVMKISRYTAGVHNT